MQASGLEGLKGWGFVLELQTVRKPFVNRQRGPYSRFQKDVCHFCVKGLIAESLSEGYHELFRTPPPNMCQTLVDSKLYTLHHKTQTLLNCIPSTLNPTS